MSRDKPSWVLWASPATMMAVFTFWAAVFVLRGDWTYAAFAVLGIAAAALTWNTVLNLRQTIGNLHRARVEDAYRIAALENDLKRARRWNP